MVLRNSVAVPRSKTEFSILESKSGVSKDIPGIPNVLFGGTTGEIFVPSSVSPRGTLLKVKSLYRARSSGVLPLCFMSRIVPLESLARYGVRYE